MGRHQFRLLHFAIQHPEWNSYGKDQSTVRAVYSLARLGFLEVNRKNRQFRLFAKPNFPLAYKLGR